LLRLNHVLDAHQNWIATDRAGDFVDRPFYYKAGTGAADQTASYGDEGAAG